MMEASIRFQIELPLTSEWRNVELLRTSVLNCLTTIFANHDFCRTIGMVTGELLENALKFGDWTQRRQFRLHVFGEGESVSIEVFNPVAPNTASADELLATIDWLSRQNSAKEAFMKRLGELHQDGDSEKSGLGLVRLAYEGGCRLEASVDDGVVCVRATTQP